MNILLTLAFNGQRYHGFQVQKNALGICTVLQNAMQGVFGTRPDVKGCSRTDAGVHARAFCASFKQETDIPLHKIPLALNGHLPPDIRILSARLVPEAFHARYAASGKEYEYVFFNAAVDDPFTLGLYYRVPHALDEAAMQQAGQLLVGRHNFAAFMSAGSDIEDTVRCISYLQVEREGQRVYMRVAADGFLYNMVRIIAGTLLWAGTGRILPGQAAEILKSCRRECAGPTLPAKALFLTKVFYPQQAFGTNG